MCVPEVFEADCFCVGRKGAFVIARSNKQERLPLDSFDSQLFGDNDLLTSLVTVAIVWISACVQAS